LILGTVSQQRLDSHCCFVPLAAIAGFIEQELASLFKPIHRLLNFGSQERRF
jgi:hypothetical protein